MCRTAQSQVKKMFKMLILSLLSMFILAACAGGTTGGAPAAETPAAQAPAAAAEATDAVEDPVSLVFSWWGNPLRHEITNAALDLFEAENPGVTIERHSVGWGDYWSMLATMAAGGNLPDVIQIDWAFVEQYVANGLLADLTPFIESGVIDMTEVDPGLVELGRVGDGIYTVSIGLNAYCMVYNVELLDSLGVDINYNMTLDEFIDISRDIYARTGYRTRFIGDRTIEFMGLARGHFIYTPEAMANGFDVFYEYFSIIAMGIEEGWMIGPEEMAGRTGMEEEPIIFGGNPGLRTWNHFFFTNMFAALQDVAPDDIVLRMTTFPSPNPQASNIVRSGQALAVTTHTDHPEVSARILDLFTNSVEANQLLIAERGIIINPRVSEAIFPYVHEATVVADNFINNVLLPHTSPVNLPNPEGASMIVNHILLLNEMVAHGQMSPEEAARDLMSFGTTALGG